ncbi:MAG TPA: hypothetical protein VGN27_08425 [Gaiellaceae bacterium]|jgi:hypothetical protein|nr:hypothetical protein [Gaiellaceae bacterium]
MRRALAWALALPLTLAGSQAAHLLAYRLVYPRTPIRARVLLETGHGYLDRVPLALGIAGGVALVSLLTTALDASRGRSARTLPPWAFGLLAPAAFALQEFLERSLHSGTFAWHAAAAPTFLPGLLVQVPFGLLAWLTATLLLRAAVYAGRAAAPARRLGRLISGAAPTPPGTAPARKRPLAHRLAERGPPLSLAV